jgi:hypothetical protein
LPIIDPPPDPPPPDDQRSWDPSHDIELIPDAADPEELTVTIGEPLMLSVPGFLDNIVGRSLGRRMRGGLARVRLASVGMAVGQRDRQPTDVTVMPTGRFTASGRFAGSAIRGEAVLRRVDDQSDELEAFPNGSLRLETGVIDGVGVGIYSQKAATRFTSGFDLSTRRGLVAAAGYSHAWNFRSDRARYAEDLFHLTYQAGSVLKVQPRLHQRRYDTGRRLRSIDWAFVFDVDRLRGPLSVTWTRTHTWDILAFNHVVATGGGLHLSWLLRHAAERPSSRSAQTVGLGADLRRGAMVLYHLSWSRDLATARDQLGLGANRMWRVGPFQTGGLQLAYRELPRGRWELRVGGTFIVPLTMVRPAGGGFQQHWGR